MTTAQAPSPQTLADVLDANVRSNVRTLVAFSGLRMTALYEAMHLTRQTFSAKLNGASRFTAAEVAMLGHLLGVATDRLYADPDEYVRTDQGSEPRGLLRERLRQELGATMRSRCFAVPVPDGQMELSFAPTPFLRVA